MNDLEERMLRKFFQDAPLRTAGQHNLFELKQKRPIRQRISKRLTQLAQLRCLRIYVSLNIKFVHNDDDADQDDTPDILLV